ncbi:tetratricopeptide repeat protein [Noviherbaspirillum pedocola]|uniref:Sel1 repeat family protein n=1 Tax=Noviherbaspirillum pedocola TaxID=2801341 RepID=A0A934W7C6_9BURK|nr:tetratricopeptide repeat protein [Noviherbaspirillum pedocola]MBK4737262.1 sel1 repeat family protein [Noviherbaspirillum pedocola]
MAWRASLPADADIGRLAVLARTAQDQHALSALERAAWSGSAVASLALGEALMARGAPSDGVAASAWLEKAAASGNARAQLAAGKASLRGGPGMPADYARARRHFEAAASTGEAGGAYYLGVMQRRGVGMRADPAAAARWLGVAADAGIPAAMFMLANMLMEGDGIAVDQARARALLERAAELDYPEASQMIAMGLRDGTMGYEKNGKKADLQMAEAAHALRHRPPEP